ncbi:MAG: 1-acyl-sn-glycerol-3-phosphate acyltransferase [Actinomycetia bacterium]|nr:1-acyl-sn-glycerol-3-phosphate acyltransferase [Actinomycetes bacterium]
MAAQKLKYSHGTAYRILYRIIQYFLMGIFSPLYRVTIIDRHKIPKQGRFIVCCNHLSYVDPVIIAAYIPRYTYFMAKKELFSVSFLSNLVTYLNAFPVSRNAMDRKSFKTSLNILKYDNILGLFPEGSRSKDGTVGEGKKGIGLISILSGAPIIPIAISGSNKIIQKPHKRLYFPKIKVIIGDIVDTKIIANENERKDAIALIVSETMDSIKKLYSKIK